MTGRARQALHCGAMQPIATELSRVDDGGIGFVVRKVSSLAGKEDDKAAEAGGAERVAQSLLAV